MSWGDIAPTIIAAAAGVIGIAIGGSIAKRNEARAWLRDRREVLYGQLIASVMAVETMMHVTVPLDLEHGVPDDELSDSFNAAHAEYIAAEGRCLLFASREMTRALVMQRDGIEASMLANIAWVSSYRHAPNSPETAALRQALEAQAVPTQAATRDVMAAARRELRVAD